jgi:hypothetical protein
MRMRPVIYLSLSIGLNVVFAALYFLPLQGNHQVADVSKPDEISSLSATGRVKTHIIVRKQFFSWSEIESDDYPTYISNLKAINCPDATIRDIIVADVNQLYAQKRAKDIPIGGPQWWRAFPNSASLQAAIEKQIQLDAEQQELLNHLLGAHWDDSPTTPLTPPSDNDLEGPLLGKLPAVIKQAVREIAAQAQQRKKSYLDEQQKSGKPIDPAELLRLEQETHDEFAHVLTPAQVDDYFLRYSASANLVRLDTRFFDASPDEFRKIFQARADLDRQIEAFAFATDSASVKKRLELERQREKLVEQSLGPERYALYALSQEPAFRDAQALIKQIGASPKTALSLYEINQLAVQERQRIKNDPNLSNEEREHALLQLQLDREKSTEQLLANKPAAREEAVPEEEIMPPMPQAP